jgi:hypothetical protein
MALAWGPSAEAATVTKTVTVPATYDFQHANRPGRPQECYAIVFARWADVPNTQSVTVNYTANGAAETKYALPPFNDTRGIYPDPPPFALTVPAGNHWVDLSATAEAGGTPNSQCESYYQVQRGAFTGSPTATITYTENAPAPPAAPAPDKVKPTISGLSFSVGAFRAATSGPSFSAKAPIGTKVSFSLSEASRVKFTVTRKARGRKVSGKCKAKTKANAKKRTCTRYVKVAGSFTVAGKAGRNSFVFRGRVGGKSLAPAKYRLSGRATDSSRNASVIRQKAFTIVK